MSIETPLAPAEKVDQVQHEEHEQKENGLENGIAEMKLNSQAVLAGESQVNGAPVPEHELHRACAGGNLDEVRGVLGRGVESLEMMDPTTGCTPIVLAIRNGHVDVVRELLSAGAIVPPPGLTADPNMLALLYPSHMYGIPPPFNSVPMDGQFFNGPSNGFFPNGPDHNAHFSRRELPNGNANANLPPAEVSKTIPCRNFPNCKYGQNCVFFHPPQPFFAPGPMRNGFVPGFEGYPQPGFHGGPYFVPNGFHSFPPPPPDAQQPPAPENAEGAPSTEVSTPSQTETPSAAPIPVSQLPSAVAPVFVPQFAPAPPHLASPPPSQYGLSPLSPSMLAGSLPSIPPAEAFFAQPPPNGFVPPFNPRRQSFGQPFANGPKPFHSKKPSFSNSGAPRPFRNSAGPNHNLGQWKDGAPPPCAFFAQGKCRNGEYCKFPHLDTENNDVRHPDVVRGVIPPLPSLGRQNRAMRMGMQNGQFGYDQSHRQSNGFAPQPIGNGTSPASAAIPEGEADAVSAEVPAVDGAHPSEEGNGDKATLPSSIPAKPAAPMPAIVRSASQPGVQRVHVNGFSSRSHSPAPSNASFHGNGHPRRGGARGPYINGQRSSSHGESKSQRVPGADEFPALGGGATSPSLTGSAAEKKDGKTAAQVLSAPAPYRPKAVPETNDVQSDKSEGSVSMEDESDSDAVIVSHKPSPAATPGKRASVSFASVISAPAELPAVGVQA